MRKLLPAVAALALSACGPAEPDPVPRVLSVVPEGEGIAPDAPGISVRFSEPVDPSGVEDGRFVALAAEADAKPAATAAALPPLEPPGTRLVSCGLRVGPKAEFSVDEPMANSSRLVLPTDPAPAAARRCTTVAS